MTRRSEKGPVPLTILLLLGPFLAGCPHDTDPESTELVGRWEAVDLGCLAGEGKTVFNRLDFLDAHEVRLGNGPLSPYFRNEPGELVIEHPGYEGYGYSRYDTELVFSMTDARRTKDRECRYRLVPPASAK